MKYEFNIEGSIEPKGSIDLHRIALIADCIRKVSEGALQIRLKGISLLKGREKLSLENALKVNLSGIKERGSIDRNDVEVLLGSKFPDWMNEKQRKTKINNLLSELRKEGRIRNDGIDYKPKWVLLKKPN